ncbi:MAG: hypothetical protein FWH24_03720 [Oscillospiraceae bacterium]|nr:hypothetical protein [Oscillospiraceae bacterium]
MKRRILSLVTAAVMIAAMFSFGTFTVSADDAKSIKPVPVIDYVTETVYVSGGHYVIGAEEDADMGEPVLMYALRIKENAAEKDLEKAKWYPSYSGEIDVSRIIPKKAGGKPYLLAFRWSNQYPTSENVAFIELKGRPSINKNDVEYDAAEGILKASGAGFEARIGNDVYDAYPFEGAGYWGLSVDPEKGLYMPPNFFPMGGVVYARAAAVESPDGNNENNENNGENETATTTQTTSSFASAAIRINIPKAQKPVERSKISLVTQDSKNKDPYFKGFNAKMELFVGMTEDSQGNRTEVWETLGKNMKVADFDKLFDSTKSDVSGKDSDGTNFKFTVRNKGGKKPPSPGTVLEFEVEKYNGTNTNNDPDPNDPENQT